jgi:hypothetical protein
MNDVDRARFLLYFNIVEGNINCISHVYNLAVQAGLTALKAEPRAFRYAYERNINGEIPAQEPESPSRLALFCMRSLIHNFKHSRYWRALLDKQCRAHNLKSRKPKLDMPVRWGSTDEMLNTFLYLEQAVRAVEQCV